MTIRSLLAATALVVLCGGACAQSAQPPVQKPAPELYRITGTVVNAVDNQPLADVQVSIAGAERSEDSREFITGSDGRFVFQNVPQGKYSLTGVRRGFSLQAYQQHDQYSTAVAVGPDLISEGLIFRMTPDASISGNVLDEENEPVRSGEAILFSCSTENVGAARQVARNRLDEEGHYRFGHLSAGSYYVAISAQPWYAQDPPLQGPAVQSPPGHVEATDSPAEAERSPVRGGSDSVSLDVVYPITYYPNATDPDSAMPIQLRPGEHATAEITLHAVPAVHARIINGSKDPSMPLTSVIEQRIFGMSLPVASRNQISADGNVTITGLPPGNLIFSIRHFTGKNWVGVNKEVKAAGDVEIDASENTTGPLVVAGVLHQPGGAAVPSGTYVRFSSRETGETFGSPVNEQGEFSIEYTMTGSAGFAVAVFNARHLLVHGISSTGARVVGHTVYFPHSGPVQLNISLSEGSGRVDGTVMQDRKPVSETMVLLVPQHPEEEPTLVRRDQSDSDGTFTLREILPGRYTLVAIEKGWELDWQNPTVLKPYLERGEVVDVSANKTYKVSLNLQSREVPAASAKSTMK
jgi:Carboxypeptidase regulatory-like domain